MQGKYLNCPECNTKFYAAPSRLKRNNLTCSKACMGKLISRETSRKIQVCCEVCGQVIYYKKSHYEKTKNPTCSYKCSGKMRKQKYRMSGNPNNRNKTNFNFLGKIDTEEKAYFLGLAASDGHIRSDSIVISLHHKDIDVLKKLNGIVGGKLTRKNKQQYVLIINSVDMSKHACYWLDITPGKKSRSVQFPSNIPRELKRHFIRGFFDGDGSIRQITEKNRTPMCNLASNSKSIINGIRDFINLPCSIKSNQMEWYGSNCLDFLSFIYDKSTISLSRKRDNYYDIATWVPACSYSRYWKNKLFSWAKTRTDAENPYKKRASDTGFDLTLVEKTEQHGNVEIYDTGVKIQPSFGIFMMVAPRSSLYKTGYMLANSVGIIDRSFLGSIKVPLVKVDKNMPDLQLPGRYVQLIPMPAWHAEIEEVDELSETQRGDDGFGSTGQ